MYKIQQKLIKVNKYTRPAIKQLGIRAIVIHYTANPGAGALNHYNYFNNGAGGRYAGAHYFIDKDNIIQIIPDNEVAYHANETGKSNLSYLNNLSVGSYRGNANVASIGIELCIEKDGSYHPNTIKQAQWLTSQLMTKYNLSSDKVVRHYDITKKNCPANLDFNSFKKGLGSTVKSSTPRSHIAVATAKANMTLRNKPSVDGKAIKTIKKGSSYKVYNILPSGWLDLGANQYVSNVKDNYFDVELVWS